ncbi:hypothetical protein HMN09_00437400 [Mycena chlorophos]|uniref:4a-hydroxytetrahydrobiopterin dehydratase n=1 Tax=Mycena chlorophos TaxID=658473 RepID=A0A8H6TGX6_MYCCL|nr:hypothetical protein HMN09_00437400 [Mycena chlorophos]
MAALRVASKVKGWPTPWLTQHDAESFLTPLLNRGWRIIQIEPEKPTAGLARQFRFERPNVATAFTSDILQLCASENHHPQWLKMHNSAKHSTVQICTTTHSALDTLRNVVCPGITLRDVRFAALLASLPSAPVDDELVAYSMDWAQFDAKIRRWAELGS